MKMLWIAILVALSLATPQSWATSCGGADFSGVWKSEAGQTLHIQQTGCASAFVNPVDLTGYQVTLGGKSWAPVARLYIQRLKERFNYEVQRLEYRARIEKDDDGSYVRFDIRGRAIIPQGLLKGQTVAVRGEGLAQIEKSVEPECWNGPLVSKRKLKVWAGNFVIDGGSVLKPKEKHNPGLAELVALGFNPDLLKMKEVSLAHIEFSDVFTQQDQGIPVAVPGR